MLGCCTRWLLLTLAHVFYPIVHVTRTLLLGGRIPCTQTPSVDSIIHKSLSSSVCILCPHLNAGPLRRPFPSLYVFIVLSSTLAVLKNPPLILLTLSDKLSLYGFGTWRFFSTSWKYLDHGAAFVGGLCHLWLEIKIQSRSLSNVTITLGNKSPFIARYQHAPLRVRKGTNTIRTDIEKFSHWLPVVFFPPPQRHRRKLLSHSPGVQFTGV